MGALCSCAEGLVSRFSGGGQPPLQAASFDGGVVGPHTKVANFTVAGDGCAIANTVIEQDQVYFEVTVKRAGCVGVGLTRKKSPDELVGHLGDGRTSWVFRSDSFGDLAMGAVIGVSYDQLQAPSMLDFFLDGEKVRIEGAEGRQWKTFVSDGRELRDKRSHRSPGWLQQPFTPVWFVDAPRGASTMFSRLCIVLPCSLC